MKTRLAAILFALAAAAACHKGESKSGPVVAKVGDEVITADELKRRLDETSPFLRARYNTLDRKKEFLENLIRNELLAQEAQRQGFDKSPAVKEQMKRAMIQELIRKQLDEKLNGADIAEADLKKFYDAHLEDFVKPERARVFHIFLPAADAKSKAEARKKAVALLKDIDAREKKGEVNAFQTVATAQSKDQLSAPMGGDLRFLSREEMAKAYSPELAAAVFEMKGANGGPAAPGDKAGPIDVPAGIELVKLNVKTVALNRSFDESKEAIRGRMARERRSRDYDEWMKKLRDGAKVTIDEAELDKVSVEAGGTPAGGMPMGFGAGHPQAITPVAPPAPNTAAAKIGGK